MLYFLETKEGSIIISVLLGFGLASLFRKSCKGNGCYVIKGPSLTEVSNNIYKIDDKCYKYTPSSTTCSSNK